MLGGWGGLWGHLRAKAEDQEGGDDVEWDHERAENLRRPRQVTNPSIERERARESV